VGEQSVDDWRGVSYGQVYELCPDKAYSGKDLRAIVDTFGAARRPTVACQNRPTPRHIGEVDAYTRAHDLPDLLECASCLHYAACGSGMGVRGHCSRAKARAASNARTFLSPAVQASPSAPLDRRANIAQS
jgi:hypothetical protein